MLADRPEELRLAIIAVTQLRQAGNEQEARRLEMLVEKLNAADPWRSRGVN